MDELVGHFYYYLLLLTHAFHLSKRETNAQALDEARSIARRPMAQSLKDEREEIVVRCHLAKGDADRAVAETAGHGNPGKLQCMYVHVLVGLEFLRS